MDAEEHLQTALSLLQQADREIEAGNQLLASEKLWNAATHALRAAVPPDAQPTGSRRDLRRAAGRLAMESGDSAVTIGFKAAEQFHSNSCLGFMEDYQIAENRREVREFIESILTTRLRPPTQDMLPPSMLGDDGPISRLAVDWVKRTDGVFFGLETVDLSDAVNPGVYLVWHSPSGRVVHVGEGMIADRLRYLRSDLAILTHRGSGSLLVTWAAVPDEVTRWGVERYLGQLWSPLVPKRLRQVPPLQVNFPQ